MAKAFANWQSLSGGDRMIELPEITYEIRLMGRGRYEAIVSSGRAVREATFRKGDPR